MSPITDRIPAFVFLSLCVILLIPYVSAAPNLLYTYCPKDNLFSSSSSTIRSNLNTLLSTLSSAANRSTNVPNFYNSTAGTNGTSTVYGLYLCRGDDDASTCRDCVVAASSELSHNCPRGKQAVTWYDQCMIRYSDDSIFAQLDDNLYLPMWNTMNITGNVTSFSQVLNATLAKVAMEAANGTAELKFATEEAKFNNFQTVYMLGQCTPDLSSSDCYQCLQTGIVRLPSGYPQGARVLFYSCNIRYEIYPFYQKVERISSIYSYCPKTTLFSTTNSNVEALLSKLSDAANHSTNPGFYEDITGWGTPTAVYGLYLCRGDVTPAACRDCVAAASVDLPQNCPLGKQAVILYDVCMIRYSNEPLLGTLDPNLHPMWNATENTDDPTAGDFNVGVALALATDKVENEAAKVEDRDAKMYWTDQQNINDNTTLYMLGQCTADLSTDDCSRCLQNCSNFLRTCCSDHHPTGGRVYYFNCNLRYELYQFYQSSPASEVNSSLVPTSNNSSRGSPAPRPIPQNHIPQMPNKPTQHHVPLIITCSVTAGALLLFLGLALRLFVWKRKVKAGYTADLSDFVTAESLQMDFNTIRAATQNFSIDRKLGQGGFGSVYKGTLENGQDIAVKRLSDNSRQGIAEFKTEVLLVAKLQHRNLVKLLGFCVSRKEIILVYELLPNSSLDKILFDPTKRMSLIWETRFKIICGIAKGLMYLHEDSRLRVVHRDLKSSNILLDETMNPKIADFGLAKPFGVDQTEDVTNTIAGTYGYMAPEYVLMGHYSIKSDVYSFGIIVLEVVSGQRNKYLNRPLLEEALLYRAWRFWHEGEALKLVDEALGDNYSREDVMKCIHIGLLCIQESVARRPNMTSIVAALGGQSITLPSPSPPNFFSGSNPTSTMKTKSSGASSGQGVSILDTSEITQVHGR